MTDINQNFSLHAGDESDVFYDIGPDDGGANLEFIEALTWRAFRQTMGVPDVSAPLIIKDIGAGVVITDPLLMTFTVELSGADTEALAGNYYYDVKIIANHGEVTTPTTGLMTVINTAIMPNVVAFKAMFPDFEDVSDTTIQMALDAASLFVDDSWGDSQAPATMYLAAHFISMATITSDTSGQFITSETIGRISVSYGAAASSGNTSGTLGQTDFGTIFNNMLTAQGFGIAIV